MYIYNYIYIYIYITCEGQPPAGKACTFTYQLESWRMGRVACEICLDGPQPSGRGPD